MATGKSELWEAHGFYELVQEISTSLVAVRASELDVAMVNCLELVGNFFDVCQVGLGQWSKAGKILPSLLTWGPRPIDDYLTTVGPGPETFAYLCRKGSLIWNSPEDLEGLPQFQEHVKKVSAISGAFWLYRNFRTHTQQLAIARVSPTVWPEDTVDCLSAIGGIFFNALYRRKAENETQKHQRLEGVISNIATKSLHMQPDSFDEEINSALAQICEITDSNVCVFLRCIEQDTVSVVSHEWCVDTVDGPVFYGTKLADDYPWLLGQLKKKKPVHLSISEKYSSSARAESKILEQIGIQSMVWEPFKAANGSHGYMGLGTADHESRWWTALSPQLGLFGNVVANAIDHHCIDLALEQAFKEIQGLKDKLVLENETLRQKVEELYADEELIGKSHIFRTAVYQAEQVAVMDSTVLLLGETGTGKGLIARRIHEQSGRNHHTMVTVNCSALPAPLIESELFGHEKGAFTGAINRKIGRFELADGGTIFLDEIGDMPIELQVKLLRVLQDQEFERVGSSTTKKVDVRVIAATNRDLDQLIEQGEFRSDLYYRLGVFPIRIPPLRERRGDIPLLVWFFISELQHRLGKSFDEVSVQAMNALTSYDWPGNIRELRNIIERAMILSLGSVLKLDKAFLLNSGFKHTSSSTHEREGETMYEVERAHIKMVLEKCNWKLRGKDGAAEHLGLKRTTLQSRMKKLGIERPNV